MCDLWGNLPGLFYYRHVAKCFVSCHISKASLVTAIPISVLCRIRRPKVAIYMNDVLSFCGINMLLRAGFEVPRFGASNLSS